MTKQGQKYEKSLSWEIATDWKELLNSWLSCEASMENDIFPSPRWSWQSSNQSRWELKKRLLEGGPQKDWDLRYEWKPESPDFTHPPTCRPRESHKNAAKARGMVTPGKTELPGRCTGLLQLWQSVFPKVYTAWVAKIESLFEFLYQRAEFGAGGMTGNLGWVVLGANLITERLKLPPPSPATPSLTVMCTQVFICLLNWAGLGYAGERVL